MKRTYAYNGIYFGMLAGLGVGIATNNLVLGIIVLVAVSIIAFVIIRALENLIDKGADKAYDKISEAVNRRKGNDYGSLIKNNGQTTKMPDRKNRSTTQMPEKRNGSTTQMPVRENEVVEFDSDKNYIFEDDKLMKETSLYKEAQQLKKELVEAGAWSLDEDDLDKAAGGHDHRGWRPPTTPINRDMPVE